MIDINKIRFKATLASGRDALRIHIINAVNSAAEHGEFGTSIVYRDGNLVVWSMPIIDEVAEDLRKDGFNVWKKDDYHRQKSWLYIDWTKEYADTDSVKLPESCPEVAPKLPKVCANCKWFIYDSKMCQVKEAKIINGDPACQGCNLYESED